MSQNFKSNSKKRAYYRRGTARSDNHKGRVTESSGSSAENEEQSQIQEQTELTNDMLKAFVDRVLVYAEDRIEIEWNFSERLFSELL